MSAEVPAGRDEGGSLGDGGSALRIPHSFPLSLRPSVPQSLSPSAPGPQTLFLCQMRDLPRPNPPPPSEAPARRGRRRVAVHSEFRVPRSALPHSPSLRSRRPPHVRKGPSGSLFVVGPLRGCVEGCAVSPFPHSRRSLPVGLARRRVRRGGRSLRSLR